MGFVHILLLGLAATIARASFCSYFGNREPGQEPRLMRCGGYRGNSCCQPDEEDIGFNVDPIFNGDEGSNCQGTVDALRCWICHPEQNTFYRNETLTVCESMCNRLLGDCGGARWRDGRVHDYYRTGFDLCKEMGFNVDNTNCFGTGSSAIRRTASKLSTLVTLLAGFLLTGLLTKTSHFNAILIGIVVTTILLANPTNAQSATRAEEVVVWAERVSLFVRQLSDNFLLVDEAQALFDDAEYNEVSIDGSEIVEDIQQRLADFAEQKYRALDRMTNAIVEEYNQYLDRRRNIDELPFSNPEELPLSIYRDSDVSEHLPYDQLTFDRRFQWNVNLNQSSIKLPNGVDRTGEELLAQINISAVLDPVFKQNLAEDPFISYQFFGSRAGFLRVFPGRPWQRNVIGFREDFDPRFRPWYIGATSGPKDVVIVVDTSRSMGEFLNGRWVIAVQTVRTILSGLTQDDFVNVITYRSSHWDYDSNYYTYRSHQVLGCRQDALQSATVARQQELIDRLNEFSPAGGSDPIRAFEEAYEMLQSSPKTGCQQFVIWVTDEAHGDNDVRCEPGYYVQTDDGTEYVPGRLCDFVSTYETLIGIVQANTRNNDVRTFSFSIMPNEQVYAAEIACHGAGSRQAVDSTRRGAIRDQGMGYFDFIEQSTSPTEVIWTSPYVDAFGLGQLLTIAQPVVVEFDRHIGVVAVDVRLSDLEQILFSQQWGSLYSFVINEEGEVIIHPRLTPAAESTTDLETPPLEMLETRDGDPDITDLLNALKNKETGNITYSGISRPILRGEDQDGIIYEEGTTSNYFYSSIEETPFSFAYNFENDDLTFIYPPDENLTSSTTTVYHDLNGYRDVFFNIYNDLMVQQPNTSADYPFSLLTFRNSTVKLAPKTFCDPNLFLRDYNYPNLFFIHNFLNGAGENVGCGDRDGIFEIRARPDTYITSGMEAHWKGRTANNAHQISLSYIGTNAGVIRAFPGVRWPRRYDPTTRPYYHRAVASRGTLAISYAYYDAAGAGKVVTLSEVLYLGRRSDNTSFECTKSANRTERCPCTSMSECETGRCERGRCVGTQVEGVVGIDIRYDDFHDQVLLQVRDTFSPCGERCDTQNCPTRCYIIDDSGNVIFSDGLRQASELDTRNYNRVPLGRVEPGVMRELVRVKNFFIPETVQVDFQGTCERLNYFVPASSEGIIRSAEEEDDYLEQRGPLRKFQNEIGCVQDILRYRANPAAIPSNPAVISGSQESACSSGIYYLTEIPNTNTYLLVVDEWTSEVMETRSGREIGLNCLIERTLYAAGAQRAVNGTCTILDDPSTAMATCPELDRTVQPVCMSTGQRGSGNVPRHLQWYIMAVIVLCLIIAIL